MNNTTKAKCALISSMLIFGTVGIFRKYIPLPSGMIAFSRGLIGMLFLLLISLIKGKKPDFKSIRKNLLPLCFSGAILGFNWILLFEAYRYTSVSVATLCYYMAPIFVILASPFLFSERLSAKKIACVIGSLTGMVFVSGVFNISEINISEMTGIFLGLGAAVFYAGVVLINKTIKNISSDDKTILQLGIAAVVLFPYILIAEDFTVSVFSPSVIFLLILVGIVHTGIAYALYFGSVKNIQAQTVALFSYIDPIAAIILSALFLKESMDIFSIIGAVLVLGSTLINEKL